MARAKTENWKKAQKKAAMPAARRKAAATMRRNNKAKKALLAHAKLMPEGMPLDMIPDKPTRKYGKRKAKGGTTRQEVVLALLQYLNGE
jgi:hypothetical protein